jgi:hypothetical protein
MNDPADELRRQIDYNTTNMGELGRYIRIKYVYEILDGFTIVSESMDRTIQHTTLDKARELFQDATDERQLLEALYRVLFR